MQFVILAVFGGIILALESVVDDSEFVMDVTIPVLGVFFGVVMFWLVPKWSMERYRKWGGVKSDRWVFVRVGLVVAICGAVFIGLAVLLVYWLLLLLWAVFWEVLGEVLYEIIWGSPPK